jgi:glucose/arabinose dehydrogenase
MKSLRTLVASLVLCTPAALFAQEMEDPPPAEPEEQQPPPMEEQLPPPMEEESQQPEPLREQGTYETQTTDSKNKVKKQVLPAKAGIDAAEGAVNALHQMAEGEQFDPRDGRKSLELAREGIGMALERTQKLTNVAGLSDESKADARNVHSKLREARTTLEQIDKRMKQAKTPLAEKEREQLGEHMKDLQSDLSDARSSLQEVATAHDISFESGTSG